MVDSAFSPEVIPLWPDGAPGSEHWSQQEQETYLPLPRDVKLVRNIARPTVAKISNYPEQGLPIHTIVRKQLWAVMIEGMPNQANQDNNRSFPNTVGRVFLPSVATAAPSLYQCMIQA